MIQKGSRSLVQLLGLGLQALVIIAFVSGCTAAPRKTLTQAQREADLAWFFSMFEQNYAPLDYKGKDLAKLKTQYLTESATITNNQDFYDLLRRFVAEFKDAHTSTQLLSSGLPKRVSIAYLGFAGVRVGKGLMVKGFAPTELGNPNYPIKLGDLIVKLDGKSLAAQVDAQLVPTRNLGNTEANYTYHFPNLFIRTSLSSKLPAVGSSAVVGVLRGKQVVEFEVPWIVRDMAEWSQEQMAEVAKRTAPGTGPEVEVNGVPFVDLLSLSMKALQGEVDLTPKVIGSWYRGSSFDFGRTFQWFDDSIQPFSLSVADAVFAQNGTVRSGMDKLKAERFYPETAWVVDPNAEFPIYVTAHPLYDALGKPTGEVRQIAHMYLHSFDPQKGELAAVEIAAGLAKLQQFGIKRIVIDMINNGGGSLEFGLKVAQSFSNKRLTMPEVQFKVSNTWLDTWEKMTMPGSPDTKREVARRVLRVLEADEAAGKDLSSKISTEQMMPYVLQPNRQITRDFEVVLLVNEMCASMCDIFAGVMQDNDLGIVIGTNTMGAGGNVVMHGQSPNGAMLLSQTESLMLRKDGTYVENNGVKPDLEVPVNEFAAVRYAPMDQLATMYFLLQ